MLGGAALLPQFRALGDSDEDDFLFDTIAEDLDLPPAITPIRRQLLLAALIRQWSARPSETMNGGTMAFSQAAALAESLAGVMDDAERQGADLSRLEELAPLPLAEHWQEASRFLILVRDQWPALLAAEGAMDPATRRNRALALTARQLEPNPPSSLVIAAGSTGSFPPPPIFCARLPACPMARWCCRGWIGGWRKRAGARSIPVIRNSV